MKALREYIINFGKLKPGKHEFEFTLDESFFIHYEYSIVKKGKVRLLLTIDKQKETLLIFTFDFEGFIVLECDRCLDEFDFPLISKKQLFVKLGEESKDNDDDLIFMGIDDYELDISPYIYEFISLEVPMHKSCDQGNKTCNPAMMDYLGHVNEKENVNEIDPRWADLKKLKDSEL